MYTLYMPPYPTMVYMHPVHPWVYPTMLLSQVYQLYCTALLTINGERPWGSRGENTMGESLSCTSGC